MDQQNDRFIAVDGVWTRYWDLGAGPPVLLIHGLGSSAEIWQHVVGPLAERHRVLVPDLIGFGYTEKPNIDYTLGAFVRFVIAFMETLGVPRSDFVGHSLGGMIALRMAIAHPGQVDRLVLASSGGMGEASNPLLRLLSIPLVGERLLRPKRSKTRQALKRYVYDESHVTEAWVDLNYNLITQPGAQRAYLSTVRNLASVSGASRTSRTQVTDRLGDVAAPTMILWGEEDRVLPADSARLAVERIPDATLVLIPASGHNPMLEQPECFNKALLGFLSPLQPES